MKFATASVALFAAGALGQTIMINTPTGALSAIQCETYQISWTGGTGPFDIRLLDGSQNLVEEISSSATSSPFPWVVNQPSGTSLIFSIHDAQGDTSSSAPFTIQTSSNSGCLGASSGAASSTAASSASSASSAAASSASVTSGSASSASASSASVSSAVSSSASASNAVSSSASASASSARPSSATVASPSASASSPASSGTASGAGALTAGVFAPIVAALFALVA